MTYFTGTNTSQDHVEDIKKEFCLSELKTLKEIIDKEYQAYGLDCDSRKLKAEAVKWVKKYGIYNLDEFLNITGEDLKDE